MLRFKEEEKEEEEEESETMWVNAGRSDADVQPSFSPLAAGHSVASLR